jgi:hypothetical protein
MSKTAVDTIIEFMKNSQYFIGNDLVKACILAKELEKQQITDAYNKGLSHGENGRYDDNYYNETYKQE